VVVKGFKTARWGFYGIITHSCPAGLLFVEGSSQCSMQRRRFAAAFQGLGYWKDGFEEVSLELKRTGLGS
jgi:hypothetical protein